MNYEEIVKIMMKMFQAIESEDYQTYVFYRTIVLENLKGSKLNLIQ